MSYLAKESWIRVQSLNATCSYFWLFFSLNFMTDYNSVRLCLRTATNKGPIVDPPGDMWAWIAMLMTIPAGNISWLVHHSSLAVLPAETSEASTRNGRRGENFACQYLKYLKGTLTRLNILRHWTSGFTRHPMEGVLRICIVLKNPPPRPGLN
jgi:hypothetical protein